MSPVGVATAVWLPSVTAAPRHESTGPAKPAGPADAAPVAGSESAEDGEEQGVPPTAAVVIAEGANEDPASAAVADDAEGDGLGCGLDGTAATAPGGWPRDATSAARDDAVAAEVGESSGGAKGAALGSFCSTNVRMHVYK